MLIAVVCAIAAGACFAAGGLLQQHVASSRPAREALTVRLLADLVRQPLWLYGIGLALLAYVLESVALAFGPLVLVQPLVVTELLAALPISMRWDGLHIRPREWAGAVAVTAGLAVGLVSAAPGAGIALPGLSAWLPALVVTTVAASAAVAAGRRTRGPLRASLFAVAAGITMAVQAALLKSVIALFKRGLQPGLTSWQLWAMVAASLLGLLFVQSAFQAGPLAASMPVVDSVSPAVAIILGVLVFHEAVRSGPWLAGIVTGLASLFAGIVLLDTSAVVRQQQRIEHRRAATPEPPQPDKPEPGLRVSCTVRGKAAAAPPAGCGRRRPLPTRQWRS